MTGSNAGIKPTSLPVNLMPDVQRFSLRLAAWLKRDLATPGNFAPVLIGMGIALYFSLRVEPGLALTAGLLAGTAGIAFFMRARPLLTQGLFLVALGFAAADIRTEMVLAPVLERETGITNVEGKIVSIERGLKGERLILALTTIDRLAPDATPARARISWRGESSDAEVGDQVRLRASLSPPPPPAIPGGFDFGRQLYFQRIGAVGFSVTPPTTVSGAEMGGIGGVIETLRENLKQRIGKAAPGQGGAIVAAVVTGKRDLVSNESRAALRDAGLAHLLAISGLHMGLATGIIFFGVRGILAMIEPIALRFPIKKWAAGAALLSGFAYLLLSGGGWSPRRAFIMAAIIFIAILVDRRALSMRNVAIAASIILLTTPEALVHAGFQMSFAAAAALIAVFEAWSRRAHTITDFSWPARFRRYAIGVGATDLVASTATSPFAVYHFNRVAIFSLPANLLAMPLMAFWIMPAAVGGLLLAPFGLDGVFWQIAAAGVDRVLDVGAGVSSWPNAVAHVPQWPTITLAFIVFGGLWLVLARSPLRFIGLAALPVAFLAAALTRAPDLFVASSGANAGIVVNEMSDTFIAVYSSRRDRFSAGVWSEAIGVADTPGRPLNQNSPCEEGGCIATKKGHRIAIIEDSAFLSEDCARADLVIALFPASGRDWRACAAPLIDKRSVWRRGAHAVWLDNRGGIKIKSVADDRGRRPWSQFDQ